MFTGIVTHRGRLQAVDRQGVDGGLVRLVLEPEAPLPRTAIGDSGMPSCWLSSSARCATKAACT